MKPLYQGWHDVPYNQYLTMLALQKSTANTDDQRVDLVAWAYGVPGESLQDKSIQDFFALEQDVIWIYTPAVANTLQTENGLTYFTWGGHTYYCDTTSTDLTYGQFADMQGLSERAKDDPKTLGDLLSLIVSESTDADYNGAERMGRAALISTLPVTIVLALQGFFLQFLMRLLPASLPFSYREPVKQIMKLASTRLSPPLTPGTQPLIAGR